MKILLISNYLPDAQPSMLRFASLLARHLPERGIGIEVLRPTPFFRRLTNHNGRVEKWLGYLDKYVVFPRKLKAGIAALRKDEKAGGLVHIADHSNAVYTRYLSGVSHLVTCHDLLAVRSALEEFPEHFTGWSGKRLQHWILRGLKRARFVVADSETTQKDVLRLTGLPLSQVAHIPLALSYPFTPMPRGIAYERLSQLLDKYAAPPAWREDIHLPLLLHVGGNQWYKNRQGVMQMFTALAKQWPEAPRLVLVGPALFPRMEQYLCDHGCRAQVLVFSEVSDEELRALYSLADLLLFPSIAEGFGWPIIEAQACGCRVATNQKAPMTAIGGESAFYIDAGNISSSAAMVAAALREAPHFRQARIEAGFVNAQKFGLSRMLDGYCQVYQALQ